MLQPSTFDTLGDHGVPLVCKLRKSLYGLKQAPRQWHLHISSTLQKLGFHSCASDPSMFVRMTDGNTCLLALYVDDGMVLGNNSEVCREVITQLEAHYKLVYQGLYSGALGFEWNRLSSDTSVITQTKFIKNLLERYGLDQCRPAKTPMDSGVYRLLTSPSQPLDDKKKRVYQGIVGSLIWLTSISRPDLSFSVGLVSRFLQAPTEFHFSLCDRILRYLAGTQHVGTTLSGNMDISIYSDSDWGSDPTNRRSISGYVLKIGQSPISWKSRQQSVVALSSTEAEYVAAGCAVQEFLWFGMLVQELLVSHSTARPVLYVDNQSAISLSENPTLNDRTKHIDIKYHFLRSHVLSGTLLLKYCPTDVMCADLLTKPLNHVVFSRLCNLNNLSMSSLKGGIAPGGVAILVPTSSDSSAHK